MKGYLSLAVILAIVLTMTSCLSPRGEDIPFGTVIGRRSADSRGYYEPEPKIVVATSPEEIDKLKILLSPASNIGNALQNIDLSTHLVVAAFQGRKQTGGYEIEVVSVKHRGDQVNVIANLVTADPRMPHTLGVTSPYYVIKVKKADLLRTGRLTFVLMNTSGRAVAKTVQEVQ